MAILGVALPVSPTVHVAPPDVVAPAPLALADPPRAPLPVETELARWLARSAEVTVRVAGRGSGTLISSDGQVLTAAHVVDGLETVELVLPDGRSVHARVAVRDAAHDLARLTSDVRDAACVPLADAAPETGAWLLAGGFPGPLSRAIAPARSIGLVLGTSTLPPIAHHAAREALLTTAHVAPGMSGGPVLDQDGRLVGVVAAMGGRVAPLATSDAIAGARCDAPFARVDPGEVRRDADHHEPDRDASLRAGRPRAVAASAVTLHVGLGVYVGGVVVAEGLVLTVADVGLGTVEQPIAANTVLDHADARVLGPVAIDGELALVRVEGLDVPPLPVTRAPRPEPGTLLEGASSAQLGIVTASGVIPGELRPFVPTPPGRHCGTLLHMRQRASPPVTLEHALVAHDVLATRGELLADAEGTIVAMQVADHASGVGYAVPLADAIERFSAVLAR